MTLNSALLQNSMASSMSTSVNSTTSLSEQQSSRYSSALLGNSSSSTRHSPLTSDMPGPSSGIGPIQHAPLVRKKREILTKKTIELIFFLSLNRIPYSH